MSLTGGDDGQSEFSILGWTALGKEVLNMTQKKGLTTDSDFSDNNEEASRDSRLGSECELDNDQLEFLAEEEDEDSMDSREESGDELDEDALEMEDENSLDSNPDDDTETNICKQRIEDIGDDRLGVNETDSLDSSADREQDNREQQSEDTDDDGLILEDAYSLGANTEEGNGKQKLQVLDTDHNQSNAVKIKIGDIIVQEVKKDCITEISQDEMVDADKKDGILTKGNFTFLKANGSKEQTVLLEDWSSLGEEGKMGDVKKEEVRMCEKMDDSADSVNETEASGYGETSGTDSSSNFPDSDFSDISRKRKRAHKSSSRLDSLVKKIMKRSTDNPKGSFTDKSKASTTSDNLSLTPSEENSQSSNTGGGVNNEAARLFQIQAFADGQMSCEEESSQVESEGESEAYNDCFVSHLQVMDGGVSSDSEDPKKPDADDDYVPTEGTDEAEEEVEEEFKSDSGSNFSDDDYTRLAKKKRKKKPKPFLCGVCNKDFISAKMLEGHMKCHIDPKSLTCNVCGKLFDFPYKLKNHAKVHNKSYECDICGRTFRDRGGFTRHRNTHTLFEKFSCKTCGVEFETEKELDDHQQVHRVPVEKLKCHTCGKEFDSKATLCEHLKSHAAIVYECDMCDKTFTEDEEYTAHLRAHDEEDDETWKCKTCNQVLPSQKELNLHQKQHATHTYICETCSRTFTDDKMYSMHLKTHKYEDIITWKCNKCKLEFMLKQELREHLKKHVVHSYKCDQCGRTFTDDILYAAHLRGHKTQEEIRWKCNKCKLEFLKKEELKEHLKIHIKPSFVCNTCGESFAYESDYNAHLKQHYSEELLECNFCPEKFVTNVGLTRHLKTHVKDVMVCETCGDTFKDRHKYAKHIRFHKAMLRCKKCGHICASKADLNSHMQSHVQHIYVCETCGETFNTDTMYTEHLKTHSDTVSAREDDEDDVPVIIIS